MITRTFKKLQGKTTFESEAYTKDGKVWRWVSNDSCVPIDAAKEYGIPVDVEAQEKARSGDLDAFFDAYTKNQPPMPSAEEQYEMRAAFGPGVEVIDVLSGRTYTT